MIVAIIADGKLWGKVGESNSEDYEKFESLPFTYVKNGKSYPMSYWEFPADILEDRDALEAWIEKAQKVHQEKIISTPQAPEEAGLR